MYCILEDILTGLKSDKVKWSEVDWLTEVVDGYHVIISPGVGFSMPPTYFYLIFELEEIFTSHSHNHHAAYAEWKSRRARLTQSGKTEERG